MISQVTEGDWAQVADLIAQSVPNALVSKLGTKAGIVYYKDFADHSNSCCFVAKDQSAEVIGMIIGTVGFDDSRGLLFKIRLLLAANIRLLKPSVIGWIGKGAREKFKSHDQEVTESPSAELLAIAVKPQARGTGLAQDLVSKLEDFMTTKDFKGCYKIRTEKMNLRSNRFYEKIGAVLSKTVLHHGNEINEWHKKIM